MSPDTHASEPPPPPSRMPRLSFTRKQYLGLPLLAAIPALTLLGVFGEQRAVVRFASRALEMTVHYPTRFRYRQIQSLDVSVRNVSGGTIDSARVSLDTAYITRFSSVRIEPAPQQAFTVTLTDLKPMESRLVTAELWGEKYGVHEGRIAAVAHTDTALVLVHTLVFP